MINDFFFLIHEIKGPVDSQGKSNPLRLPSPLRSASIKTKLEKKQKNNTGSLNNSQVVGAAGGEEEQHVSGHSANDGSHTVRSDQRVGQTHNVIMSCAAADSFTPYRDNDLICQRTEHL